MLLRSLRSTLFPYTTLFRSRQLFGPRLHGGEGVLARLIEAAVHKLRFAHLAHGFRKRPYEVQRINQRSEEHTSELQSLRHLVCRLLLEKKKKKKIINNDNKL